MNRIKKNYISSIFLVYCISSFYFLLQKISAAIDIVNSLLQSKEAIDLLCDDIQMTKLIIFIDTLLSIIKIYSSYTTKASMFYIDEDTAGNGNQHYKHHYYNIFIVITINAFILVISTKIILHKLK